MRKIIFGVLGIFLITQFSIILPGYSVDLVEMKKKEEERRKKLKQSKYKLNNSNLNSIDVPKKKYSFMQVKPNSKTPKTVDRDGSKKNPPTTKKTDPVKTQKYWRELKNQLQNEIVSLNNKINKDQLRLNQLNTDLISMGLPSKRAALKDEISKLSANLDQDRKKLKKLQAELEALYERARKEGIPPGWLR
jgi:hypothetical protein